MMDKNIKTIGLSFVENLDKKDMAKEELFEQLYKVLGRDCDLKKDMRLPSASSIAYLESNKAKYQIKAYEEKIVSTFNKLNQTEKIGDKKALLDVLKILTAKPRDYAVMALDKYLRMDKANTIDGFYKEYSNFAERQKELSGSRPHDAENQAGKNDNKKGIKFTLRAINGGAEIA